MTPTRCLDTAWIPGPAICTLPSLALDGQFGSVLYPAIGLRTVTNGNIETSVSIEAETRSSPFGAPSSRQRRAAYGQRIAEHRRPGR